MVLLCWCGERGGAKSQEQGQGEVGYVLGQRRGKSLPGGHGKKGHGREGQIGTVHVARYEGFARSSGAEADSWRESQEY